MKIKKYKNFGILLFILIITIAIIPNFIITLLDNIIEKDSPSAYSFSQGDIYSLGIVFGEQRQKIEWTGSQFGPEDSVTGYGVVDGKTVPKQDPYILYCTEYGTGFWTGNGTRHYATSLEGSYGTIEHYYKSNPHESITYTGKWHCTGIHIEQKYDGELSFPWLVKESDINLIKAGGDENISLAYALTSKEIDKYSEEKQMAIWALKGQRGQTSLSEEAKQYAKYYEKTQVDRGSTELPDLDIKGSAEDLKVLAHYDEQKGGTLTIGPINLTYINQNNDSIAFEGISAMYFRGYNKKGEMVKGKTSADRIKVEYVIDSNGKYVPKFFNPKKEECYVDHNKQAYPDGQGDGEFYLVIKDPNIGKTSKDEDFIAELDLRITFKWMTIFDAQVSNFNSYEYQVNWYEHLYPITHSDPDYSYNLETKRWEVSGYHSDSSCLKRVKLEEASLQKVLCYYGGGRELFTTTFTIGNVGERINITMDLGGNVWKMVYLLKNQKQMA